MLRGWADTKSRPFTLLLGMLAAAFVLCIILFPDEVFQSSLRGLRLWWEFVFPALLPFMIVSEIMIGLGVIHGLGTLLEPLMRKMFRLPGSGGWALAMGLTAGYPLGADITARLRKEGALTEQEASRLASVSFLCSPMVMVGIVGSGFLHSPRAGLALAAIHYVSALAVGLIGRLASREKPVPSEPAKALTEPKEAPSLPVLAVRRFHEAREEDGRTFGKLLGDSVSSSVQTLMMLGGFIMIFSVLLQIVQHQAGTGSFGEFLSRMLPGLMEPHLGTHAIAETGGMTPVMQAAFISFVLAWGGLSLHMQLLSLAGGSGVRYLPFALNRLLHGGMALLLTVVAWEPLQRLLSGQASEPVLSVLGRSPDPSAEGFVWNLPTIMTTWTGQFLMLVLLLAAMLLLSSLAYLLRRKPAA